MKRSNYLRLLSAVVLSNFLVGCPSTKVIVRLPNAGTAGQTGDVYVNKDIGKCSALNQKKNADCVVTVEDCSGIASVEISKVKGGHHVEVRCVSKVIVDDGGSSCSKEDNKKPDPSGAGPWPKAEESQTGGGDSSAEDTKPAPPEQPGAPSAATRDPAGAGPWPTSTEESAK
ncbi:MAG: hypothetical protein MK135_00445 [Polyangiaceae bacterium]|nr:hypothetical protein [Polyangiaceae bacterium]